VVDTESVSVAEDRVELSPIWKQVSEFVDVIGFDGAVELKITLLTDGRR